MRNVALFGQMASGKSVIAQGLVDRGFVKLAFADPLKNISELAYGPIDKAGTYPITSLDGIETNISGREVLQRVGQSIKAHDRDFWLKCFFNVSERLGGQPQVVDDGRFFFEADALRRRGWLIVGVYTPEHIRLERYRNTYGRYPTNEELNHASEIELPGIIAKSDVVIMGDESANANVEIILDHETYSTQGDQ